ncbi:DUF1992 domain-containing protein [Pseudophaeobacter sp.]|uniref:DnaJ family domain-containing protein n=1 Tax=Pseudophaeobacter sp. TaxID=1971739 RepID=UPI0032968F82
MDHPLEALINARIAAAQDEGDFDNLPGAGKPLAQIEDPEGTVFHRMLRDAGAVPEFVALARELAHLRQELQETGDRSRRQEILKAMSMMEVRIEMARQSHKK